MGFETWHCVLPLLFDLDYETSLWDLKLLGDTFRLYMHKL